MWVISWKESGSRYICTYLHTYIHVFIESIHPSDPHLAGTATSNTSPELPWRNSKSKLPNPPPFLPTPLVQVKPTNLIRNIYESRLIRTPYQLHCIYIYHIYLYSTRELLLSFLPSFLSFFLNLSIHSFVRHFLCKKVKLYTYVEIDDGTTAHVVC